MNEKNTITMESFMPSNHRLKEDMKQAALSDKAFDKVNAAEISRFYNLVRKDVLKDIRTIRKDIIVKNGVRKF